MSSQLLRPYGPSFPEERNAPSCHYFPEHPRVRAIEEVISKGDVDETKRLIENWKLVNDPPCGPQGFEIYTLEPLYYHAIREKQPCIVKYFMEKGIRLCREVMYEAIETKAPSEIFQIFLDYGWDINNEKEGLWASPLGMLVERQADEKLIRWFLEKGADPNGRFGGGQPGEICLHSPLSIIKLFRQFGGRTDCSIVVYATRSCQPDRLETIRYLLDNGAPIDATEYEHDDCGALWPFNHGSALTLACSFRGNEDIIELLLTSGASIEVVNWDRKNCLDLAKESGSPRQVELVLDHMQRHNSRL